LPCSVYDDKLGNQSKESRYATIGVLSRHLLGDFNSPSCV